MKTSHVEILKKQRKNYANENDFCGKVVYDLRNIIIFPECKYEENDGFFSYPLEEKFRNETLYPLLKKIYREK